MCECVSVNVRQFQAGRLSSKNKHVVAASAKLTPPILPSPNELPDVSDTRKGVQSVEHAFSLLQIFTQAKAPLAVKDLADISGMPASKVHHYLVSLGRAGAVRQAHDGCYELGSFAMHLGLAALRRLEPIEIAVTAARKLRQQTGETTFIAVWGSFGPTIIRYFEGVHVVTVEVRTGNVLPLTTSATGKVFLTWGTDSLLKPVLTAEKADKNTIERICTETSTTGLGKVAGDLLPRITSLAAPVFDQDGRLALTITQLGWTGEFDDSINGKIATALKQAAENLSFDLGCNAESVHHTESAHKAGKPEA